MQILKNIRFDNEAIYDKVFEKVKYDRCDFFKLDFDNVLWDNCHFHNHSFSGASLLSNCKFKNCKFTGQRTYMGIAKYVNCQFEDVFMKDIQFWSTTFINCRFSGLAENIVFYGVDAPEGWKTKFENVDIRSLKLELVDFRCNFDFSATFK